MQGRTEGSEQTNTEIGSPKKEQCGPDPFRRLLGLSEVKAKDESCCMYRGRDD